MIEFCGVLINPRQVTAISMFDTPDNGDYPHGIRVKTSDGETYSVKYQSKLTRDNRYRDILCEVDSSIIKWQDVGHDYILSEIAKSIKRIDNRIKKMFENRKGGEE